MPASSPPAIRNAPSCFIACRTGKKATCRPWRLRWWIGRRWRCCASGYGSYPATRGNKAQIGNGLRPFPMSLLGIPNSADPIHEASFGPAKAAGAVPAEKTQVPAALDDVQVGFRPEAEAFKWFDGVERIIAPEQDERRNLH